MFRKLHLKWRLIFPIAAAFVLGSVLQLTYINQSSTENTIQSVEKFAVDTINQYKVIRGYYTNNIVKKTKKSGAALKFHFNHVGVSDTLPLPATFIHDLSNEFSKNKDGIKLRLYSKFPFPNRVDRQLDKFQKDAIDYLVKNPDKIFKKTYLVDGNEHVRVAIGDKLVSDGCVSCHNVHPDTPYNKWKLGDVRGVLEVETSLKTQIAAIKSTSNRSILISFAFTALVLIFIYIFVFRTASKIENLSTHLKESSSDTSSKSIVLGNLSSRFSSHVQSQAAAVQETVAALDEINSMAHATSDNIDHIDKLSTKSSGMASEGKTVVTDMVNSMSVIDSNGQELLREVEQNSNDLKDVVSIFSEVEAKTNIINDIVFQTKLLSFNASVEAARAGEQGKGFAVVATEVGNLAAMSGGAADEISSLLENSVKKVESIISNTRSRMQELVSSGQKSIEDGVQTTERCRAIFDNLHESVDNIKKLMEALNTAANEQSLGIQGITEAVNDINRSALEFDRSLHELESVTDTLAVHSNELNGHTITLNEIVLGDQMDIVEKAEEKVEELPEEAPLHS